MLNKKNFGIVVYVFSSYYILENFETFKTHTVKSSTGLNHFQSSTLNPSSILLSHLEIFNSRFNLNRETFIFFTWLNLYYVSGWKGLQCAYILASSKFGKMFKRIINWYNLFDKLCLTKTSLIKCSLNKVKKDSTCKTIRGWNIFMLNY